MNIAIIPARGGSKGIPKKNIKPICGYPLIYWSIEAAKKSKSIDKIYVSTDDDEIAKYCDIQNIEVLKRPENLAQDDSTTLDVLIDICDKITCDYITVLQPTSPIRDSDLIDSCFNDLIVGNYDSLATGYNCKIIEYATHKNKRRQDIEGFFYDDGNIYMFQYNVLKEGKWYGDNICKKIISKEQNFEIDDYTDFKVVEELLYSRIFSGIQKISINEKLKDIKLFVTDVDGVLTDSGMYYSEKGDEQKKFNTRDGKGIEILRNIGIKTAIITSENTKIVKNRAKKLKFDYLFQGVTNKDKVLVELSSKLNIGLDEILFIGDDINDLSALRIVGIPVTVIDASPENKKIAEIIVPLKGGEGCVRYICDLIYNLKKN
tara:strand:- start:12 stop:1136 length:1125 start_codon:yes stop_codon:yes gene_type:complete